MSPHSPVLASYAPVALVALLVIGGALLGAAARPIRPAEAAEPDAWKQYRFGFATTALVFLAFDMEMIFMYPWAVVFAETGREALLDMLIFIALLSAGLTYAWSMGGLDWE
jgi:NADH-quinone oxidoreductase subunit A